MDIDKYKFTVNRFTAELDSPIDRDLRTLVTIEADIYSVDTPSNEDGTFDKVYKAKLVGSTIIKQGKKKPILAKSKRSASKKLRSALWYINPEEEFYQVTISKIIANLEDVVEFLKDK